MKTSYVLFLLFLSFGSAKSQSCEIVGYDTINMIDKKGYKKGKWVIKGMHYFTGRTKTISGYRPDQTVETGIYNNNRKEGIWEEYYSNGKMRSTLTYVNGVLEGPATFYNSDGKVMKEGSFKGNKWVQ